MGIESEQLVYDYLSQVGDLAGRTPGLTAAQRARLVNELRQTIDSQRASASSGPATSASSVRAEVGSVRRILKSLGSPEDVVRRASGGAVGMPSAGPSVPAQTRSSDTGRSGATGYTATPSSPEWAPRSAAEGRVEFVSERVGDAGGTAAWWTPEPEAGGYSASGSIRMIQPPGWTGSFEGDFLSPDGTTLIDPVTRMPIGVGGVQPAGVEQEPEPDPLDQQLPKPSLLRRLLGGGSAAGVPAPVSSTPRSPIPFVETLATLVLAAAAVLGLWYIAVLGWLFAYTGRRLGRRVAVFASLWIPGLVAAACGFWLYSRSSHPAGHPGLSDAVFATAAHNAFAFWLRASAGVSAAFLAWRVTRR